MKKFCFIILVMFFYSSNVNAICFLNCKTPGLIFSVFSEDEDTSGYSGFDPTASGCVYNEFGQKVKCVSYKYNDSKNSGSYAKAKSKCVNKLKKYVKENYTLEGCH